MRPLPFLVPTYGHGLYGREAMTLGLWLNDLLASDRNDGLPESDRIDNGRMLSPAEVRERVPGLADAGLTGGALWTDAQAVSSERLLLAFLHAASDAGAALATLAAGLSATAPARPWLDAARARHAHHGVPLPEHGDHVGAPVYGALQLLLQRDEQDGRRRCHYGPPVVEPGGRASGLL